MLIIMTSYLFYLQSGLHASHITLSYAHLGQIVYVDLKLQDALLPNEHFLRYQNAKLPKQYIVKKFNKTELDLCHYQVRVLEIEIDNKIIIIILFLKGTIRGKPESSVALSTCNGGINGIVFDGTETYFIHSGSDGEIHDKHLIFR